MPCTRRKELHFDAKRVSCHNITKIAILATCGSVDPSDLVLLVMNSRLSAIHVRAQCRYTQQALSFPIFPFMKWKRR